MYQYPKRSFTAITRVQIPSGTPIESIVCADFRLTFEGAKSHILVPILHPQNEHGYAVPMMESSSAVSVIGKNKASTAACAACWAGATAWGVNIHGRPQRGMPHQFLHHFEFGSDASEKRRIGVAEGMPADALLDVESFG